jgi:hypothetical protein
VFIGPHGTRQAEQTGRYHDCHPNSSEPEA